jgi:UPF0755 protein
MNDRREPYDWEERALGDREPAHRRPDYLDDGYDDEYPDDPEYAPDDEDYVELRRASSRGRRILTVIVGIVLVLAVAVGGTAFWVKGQIDPSGDPGEPTSITIPEGATSDDIGALLADEGVISSDFVWGWYLRINGGGPFEAGVYELPTNSAIPDVIDLLDAGPAPIEERSFTMPEGLTVPETLARLASPEDGLGFDQAAMQELLDTGAVTSQVLGPDLPSSEGILFPETYRVAADADEQAVLQQMVTQLDSTLTDLHVETAQDRFNLSPYEILIVASLIEEETKVDEERGKVAQVIYNRLRQDIPLGIDATSRYEAELAGRDRDDIDFESDSPYNTRRNQGLPPTPIASPGRASIEAALNPTDGPWIYYVLEDADGHHFFTDSNDEFINAKNRCADLGLGCG